MKITVYTTSDCQFSKEEKEYLASHSLAYEEKNLEMNKDFLTEMLAVGNNFAGTPVTKIEKDDGSIVVLKGFTKEEFDTTLNLAPPAAPVVEAPKVEEPVMTAPQAPEPPAPEPMPPVTPEPPPMQVTPPAPVAPEPTPPVADPQLNSILNDLQAKVTSQPPVEPPVPMPPTPTPTPEPTMPTPPPAPVEPMPPTPPTPTMPGGSVADSLPKIPDPNFNG